MEQDIFSENTFKVNNNFWNRYFKIIKEKVIIYQWNILNDKVEDAAPSHAIDNYRIAAGLIKGNFYGEVFQDSDLAKWLEAVGNVLMLKRDEDLEEKADSLIDIIEKAQQPDGYLNTYFIVMEPDKKWTNTLECHELYCAGHFIEAAVAYYKATKKEKVLRIAIKLANHIYDVFGPEENKIHGYPGHQEIELALIKLYDLTKDIKYFDLAKYFIDIRGTNNFFEEEFEKRDWISFWGKNKIKDPNRMYNQFSYKNYNQFHLPVREQDFATGHAVRAVYMYTAMADIAARTKDEELGNACKALWNDIVNKKMYITGGIGSTHMGEAFTTAYDLPNDTIYAETCASIGLMFFANRMLDLEINSTYGDTIERALYNTVLGGINFEGDRFFYVNPLWITPATSDGNSDRHHVKSIRQKWFTCACCPPNIARTIPSIDQYAYSTDGNTMYNHLYLGSEGEIKLDSGNLSFKEETNYPWENQILFTVSANTDTPLTLAFRIPGWCKKYKVLVNNEEIFFAKNDNGYIYIERDFSQETKILLELDMPPVLMESNARVSYNSGRVAITRGPLVYAIEEIDNGKYLDQITLNSKSELSVETSDLFDGCIIINGKGYKNKNMNVSNELYTPYNSTMEEVSIKAIPYYLWNNRGSGEMQVWIRAN